MRGELADADALAEDELEAHEVLEGGGHVPAPFADVDTVRGRRRRPGSGPRSAGYIPHSSFTSVVLPAPLWPTSAIDAAGGQLERQRAERGLILGAGIREPQPVEHDPGTQARRRRATRRELGHAQRSLVVLILGPLSISES